MMKEFAPKKKMSSHTIAKCFSPFNDFISAMIEVLRSEDVLCLLTHVILVKKEKKTCILQRRPAVD